MASAAPKNIIDGLQLFVPGMELKTLCQKRVAYHQERAKFAEAETARAKTEIDRLTPLQSEFERQAEEQNKGMSYGNRSYQNSPIENARQALGAHEQSYKHHKNKSIFFTFFADHVDTESTYKLDEGDLHKLEVL